MPQEHMKDLQIVLGLSMIVSGMILLISMLVYYKLKTNKNHRKTTKNR